MPVVDSSVAVKWVVDEPGRAAAIALLKASSLSAPDFIQVEVRSALWNRVQRKLATAEQSRLAAAEFGRIAIFLLPAGELTETAFALALELSHPIYDCLYLAAAIQLSQRLVTADRRFLAALAGSAYADRVVALTEFPHV